MTTSKASPGLATASADAPTGVVNVATETMPSGGLAVSEASSAAGLPSSASCSRPIPRSALPGVNRMSPRVATTATPGESGVAKPREIRSIVPSASGWPASASCSSPLPLRAALPGSKNGAGWVCRAQTSGEIWIAVRPFDVASVLAFETFSIRTLYCLIGAGCERRADHRRGRGSRNVVPSASTVESPMPARSCRYRARQSLAWAGGLRSASPTAGS